MDKARKFIEQDASLFSSAKIAEYSFVFDTKKQCYDVTLGREEGRFYLYVVTETKKLSPSQLVDMLDAYDSTEQSFMRVTGHWIEVCQSLAGASTMRYWQTKTNHHHLLSLDFVPRNTQRIRWIQISDIVLGAKVFVLVEEEPVANKVKRSIMGSVVDFCPVTFHPGTKEWRKLDLCCDLSSTKNLRGVYVWIKTYNIHTLKFSERHNIECASGLVKLSNKQQTEVNADTSKKDQEKRFGKYDPSILYVPLNNVPSQEMRVDLKWDCAGWNEEEDAIVVYLCAEGADEEV